MNQVEIEDDAELKTLGLTSELFTAVLTAAARNLTPRRAAELRQGMDSGELDVHLSCVWSLSAMRVRASAVNKAGVGNVILDLTVPAPPDDETESCDSGGAMPQPGLH